MLDISSPLDGIVSPFGASRGFSPKALFASGAQGFWYDPSDFSTMFQDNLGATPVTATGQVVGRIMDKSGRNNHATQSNASFKPTLQQDGSGFYYLSFDGTDDSLATSAIDFIGADKVSLFTGLRKASDASPGMLVEFSANFNSNAASFFIIAPPSANPQYATGSRGDATAASNQQTTSTSTFAAPITNVLTALHDIATDASILRINGAPNVGLAAVGDKGAGNFGNYPLYVGRRGGASLAFNGRLYSLIGLGAAASAAQISSTEAWINAKTGAY